MASCYTYSCVLARTVDYPLFTRLCAVSGVKQPVLNMLSLSQCPHCPVLAVTGLPDDTVLPASLSGAAISQRSHSWAGRDFLDEGETLR